MDSPFNTYNPEAQPDSIHHKFMEFHLANPHVYNTLLDLATDAVNRGHTKMGIGMLWEVMRWRLIYETTAQDDFKLNNNFRSRYARMLMDREPHLRGVFETRSLKTA